MFASTTFLFASIVVYISIATVPVYTISPFTVGTSLIDPFVKRLNGSIGPLKYKFEKVESNGFTMIAEKKRHSRCLWICKDSRTIYQDLCVSMWANTWDCKRKNLTQFEKWTRITFSAENNCKQITNHLYAAYRHSRGIKYKNFAEDIGYLLREYDHLYECHVQSTLHSNEFERGRPLMCQGCSGSDDWPQAVTQVQLHFF